MKTMLAGPARRTYLLLGLALGLAACSDDPTAPGAEPVTIELDRADVRLESLGQTVQFSARVLDASGQEMAGVPLEWISDTPSRLESLGDGAFRAVANGPAQVMVRAGGAVALATVRVEQEAAGLALSLDPGPGSSGSIEGTTLRLWALEEGASLRARWADALGHGVGNEGLYPALESLDPHLVQVEEDGTLRAVGNGIARVRVTLAPFSTILEVHVQATFAVESCVSFGGEGVTGRDRQCSTVEITARKR